MIPGFLMPFENELFSSWYLRLSSNHLIKNYNFTKFYFKDIPIWDRDIDLNPSAALLKSIAELTPLYSHEISNMFLPSLEGVKVPKVNSNSVNRFILPLGIYHRTRKKYGMLFCPGCLSQQQYYKLDWRLAHLLICTTCQMELSDCCSKCLVPVMYHRLDVGIKSFSGNLKLSNCWNCGYNFIFDKLISRNHLLIQYQSDLEKIGVQNQAVLLNRIELYICFLSLVCFRNQNRVKQSFIQETGIDISEIDNTMSLITRKKVLPSLHQLFSDRDSIYRFINKYSLKYSYFDGLSKNQEEFDSKLDNSF